MSAVLLRMAGTNAFDLNPQTQPPDRELAEAIERAAGAEGDPVVRAFLSPSSIIAPSTALMSPVNGCGDSLNATTGSAGVAEFETGAESAGDKWSSVTCGSGGRRVRLGPMRGQQLPDMRERLRAHVRIGRYLGRASNAAHQRDRRLHGVRRQMGAYSTGADGPS
jgi:hypothetical protein